MLLRLYNRLGIVIYHNSNFEPFPLGLPPGQLMDKTAINIFNNGFKIEEFKNSFQLENAYSLFVGLSICALPQTPNLKL